MAENHQPGSLLGLLIPQTELLLGHIVVEAVALLAAPNAALVGGDFPGGLTALAVLQHAGVPLDAKSVAANAGFPAVHAEPAALQVRQVSRLRQHLKHGAICPCRDKQSV